MSTLAVILLATAAGSLLSFLLAGALALSARPSWIPVLVSYAIGALLGASLLEVLPEAVEIGGDIETVAKALLGGILLFFLLEKLVLWRHCHEEICEAHGGNSRPAHGHDHGRSGLMITVGDTFHNFVDGVIIAGAFLADFRLGVVTALAIIAHEIPQEIGDFLILLHSGYSRGRALLLNFVTGVATLVGALVGYYALSMLEGWTPVLLGLAGASMLYVALSDLIPGLHKRAEIGATLQQLALIGLGIGSVALVGYLIGHGH
ncbi:ZIP Zinc transporter [Thiobacillus denitrificans ATCC 25259]|uniref:ZIP Zinc transporter n=1 Tax=Thiobacillus denitrificans (strain ATCC 25259 / T1) TaxID=292415 RepID=Q3SI15_THIDA|nr:ZIP family metal transporter [Thiobacillus denitrificans]AAZ97718.1 ZIP Zinc transporter [Thiobacillus denitrificans ATCC 25259]